MAFAVLSQTTESGEVDKIVLTSGTVGRRSSMERIKFETTVQYEPSQESKYADLCCDLSEGGLYIKTKYPFDTDETLTVSFTLPKQGEAIPISCKARVAWTNFETNRRKIEYPSGVGLQFLDLSTESLSALAKFIDAYDESKKMNVVCAWCGSNLGMRNGPFGTTSHGICSQCREKLA